MALWPAYLAVGLVLVLGLFTLLASAWVAGASPGFWYGLGRLLLADLGPVIASLVLGRMEPAQEAAWRHERLSGVKAPRTGVTAVQRASTRRNRSKP